MAAQTSRSSGKSRAFPHIGFLNSLKPTTMKLGLENISKLLCLLGDPQNAYPSILVAGTNGKGSVVAFLTSILMASGLRVGTFFSPHIFRLNERIRLDGDEIPSADLDEILGVIRAGHRKIPFTYFEAMTAAAALYFEREKVDVAVFEVGLGGRLDATRLVDAAVTVITGISIDHHEHLGTTAAGILGEKLGIVRKGIPLVVNLEKDSLAKRARRRCEGESAPFHNVAEEVQVERFSLNWHRTVMDMTTPQHRYTRLVSRMIGGPQARNIATAVRTVEVLAQYRGGDSGGGEKRILENGGWIRPGCAAALPERYAVKAVREGIEHAFLAGRFQVLPGNPRVILDVSHNEESLAASLETLLGISAPDRNVLLFAVQAHKRLGNFPSKALRSARLILLATLDSERGATSEDLLQLFQRCRHSNAASVESLPGIGTAVRRAKKSLRKGDSLLILGSHMTVENAVRYL